MKCYVCGKVVSDGSIPDVIISTEKTDIGVIQYETEVWTCSDQCETMKDIIIHFKKYMMPISEVVNHLIKMHGYTPEILEKVMNSRCQKCGKTFFQKLTEYSGRCDCYG